MKPITWDIIYEELAKHKEYGFGFICGGTSARPDNIILQVVQHLNPKMAVEIGTYRGLTSSIIASVCDKVHTYDIEYRKGTEFIWDLFKVKERIFYHVVNDNFTKKHDLFDKEFDFAYVDGDHSIPGVEFDFEITKKCGHVLFDDADGIAQFLKTIKSVNITKRFAYWSADGDYDFIKDIQKNITWREMETIGGRMDKMEYGRCIMRKEGLTKEEFSKAWTGKD